MIATVVGAAGIATSSTRAWISHAIDKVSWITVRVEYQMRPLPCTECSHGPIFPLLEWSVRDNRRDVPIFPVFTESVPADCGTQGLVVDTVAYWIVAWLSTIGVHSALQDGEVS